jgi:hypothetical protein
MQCSSGLATQFPRLITDRNPKTLKELNAGLETTWEDIQPEAINKLCKSFKARLVMCSEISGEAISNNLWMTCERECVPEFDSAHQDRDRV